MFGKPSLMTRIAIGKTVGFLFGLAGFITLPWFIADVDWLFRWGILFWYTTLGAIIGLFGVFNYHPILKLPMPWWFRAPFMGAWLNFVLTLLVYDEIAAMMSEIFAASGWFQSPFWLVAEGAVIGFVIGFLATRFGGEGKASVHAAPTD